MPPSIRIDFSRFVNGVSWVLTQKVGSFNFQENVPPVTQHKITVNGSSMNAVKEDINWGDTPDAIGMIHNGEDRDIAISPNGVGLQFGYPFTVDIYQSIVLLHDSVYRRQP